MTRTPTMTPGYTTCVTGVHADMINAAMPGEPPDNVRGATWIEIRIGTTRVQFPWTAEQLPAVGATVTIEVETS